MTDREITETRRVIAHLRLMVVALEKDPDDMLYMGAAEVIRNDIRRHERQMLMGMRQREAESA